ncbi:MAG: ornithine carbamoyltransferase [Spirochaetia bacterium]|nr:ornithine carbamoyltransferase [Spirochaetia bacterium]
MRNFLSLKEINSNEFLTLIKSSLDIKKNPFKWSNYLTNKNIGLLFEKPSTRTRISFEVAINHLGGRAIILKSDEIQLSRGESIEDTAIVLGKYLDGVIARVFSHDTLNILSNYSKIPVINALSDKFHPCQALADFVTIYENKEDLMKAKICYLGDGNNNVCHSLILAAGLLKSNFVVSSPEKYKPDNSIVKYAESMGAKIEIISDPFEAVKNADVLYTDVWVSMGKEKEKEQRLKTFKNYQLNSNLLNLADPNCIVLHCLPAYDGLEITKEVMYSNASRIFDQAENRLHSQKALLHFLYNAAEN